MQKVEKGQELHMMYVPIDELKPAEYNPRSWSDEATNQLKESLTRFGLVDACVVNKAPGRENIVIGGHFRLKVAKELGYTEVPVVYVNIPDREKEKELNLRLNRNTGEWDFNLLKQFDIDLLLDVGFDDKDLSAIWDDVLSIEDDDFDVEKAVAEVKVPKTKVGDLYQLGDHRLLCADSLDLGNVQRLVGSVQPDMLYFDPPYNISLDYNKGVSTNGKYGGQFTHDSKSRTEYKAFLQDVLNNGLAVSSPDCHVFTWCDENYIGLLQELYGELGVNQKRVCLWVKNNHNMTPQVAFNKVFEPCVYGTRGTPYLAPIHNLNEILNQEIGTGNRVIDDILDLLDIWLVKRLPAQEYEHPTAKPPTLHEKALRRCTKPGDAVLDLFGGSGSTLIACEQLKRRAFLCEIDPIFCDVIIKRFTELTGKETILCN